VLGRAPASPMAAPTGNDNSKAAACRTFARMNAIQVFLW
jgi:hypothetical protein